MTNWTEVMAYGIAFGIFYALGIYSGYQKAKKRYREF